MPNSHPKVIRGGPHEMMIMIMIQMIMIKIDEFMDNVNGKYGSFILSNVLVNNAKRNKINNNKKSFEKVFCPSITNKFFNHVKFIKIHRLLPG